MLRISSINLMILIASISFGIVLSGCSPKKKDPTEVREYNVGGERLFIPRAYIDFGHAGLDETNVLLQAWYPGSAPVPGKPNDLWIKGEWYKNVRILIGYPPKPNPVGGMKSIIELNKADKKIGMQYGLIHYTQSDQKLGFKDEIFVEDLKTGSFIKCTERQDENDPVQICKHIFGIGKNSFNITYNMKLLPHWKEIKTNAIEVFTSFKSPETASIYIQQFYPAQIGE